MILGDGVVGHRHEYDQARGLGFEFGYWPRWRFKLSLDGDSESARRGKPGCRSSVSISEASGETSYPWHDKEDHPNEANSVSKETSSGSGNVGFRQILGIRVSGFWPEPGSDEAGSSLYSGELSSSSENDWPGSTSTGEKGRCRTTESSYGNPSDAKSSGEISGSETPNNDICNLLNSRKLCGND